MKSCYQLLVIHFTSQLKRLHHELQKFKQFLYLNLPSFVFPGTDAANDFEDVGHSDSAREMLNKYYIGEIDVSTVPTKRTYFPPQQLPYNHDKTSEFVSKILQFLIPLLLLVLAFLVRHYTKKD